MLFYLFFFMFYIFIVLGTGVVFSLFNVEANEKWKILAYISLFMCMFVLLLIFFKTLPTIFHNKKNNKGNGKNKKTIRKQK